MSGDVPSIIVGGGRIGSALKDLGMEGDVLLKRGDPFPASPATGPIYVTTRNNDLQGVIDMTPANRRADLGACGPCMWTPAHLDAAWSCVLVHAHARLTRA